MKKNGFGRGTTFAIMLTSTLLGAFLTESDGMFYNLLLFPLAGFCGFLALRKKAWIAPLGVFAISCVCVSAKYLLQRDTLYPESGADFYAMLASSLAVWATLYALLCAFGAALGALYVAAFTRGICPMLVRALAGLAAAALTAGLLLLVNSLVGNPVSLALTKNRARDYVKSTYADPTLVVDSAGYSFKDGRYYAHIRSEQSIDTHFTLRYNAFGQLWSDSYAEDVTSGWNTLMRVDSEYRALCEQAFAAYPYAADIAFGELSAEKDAAALGIETDKVYDVSALGRVHGKLCVYVQTDTVTEKAAAEALLALRRCFDAKNIGFASVDFTLEGVEHTEDGIPLLDFLYEDIAENGMEMRVAQCRARTEAYYAAVDAEKAA